MPTALTHQILAEEVYRILPGILYENITSLAHYYLGAQGADICFPCPPFDKRGNLGQNLHNRSSLLFFRILRQEAKDDPLVRSYAYGYVTHYAADTVFHPRVYRAMGDKDRAALHHSIEHAYDGEIVRIYRGEGLLSYRLPALSSALDGSVYNVYRRYALACGLGELPRTAFEWGGKVYLAAAKVRTPLYRRERAGRAEELFERAKRRSESLAKAFEEGKLSAERFGKRLADGKGADNSEKRKKIIKIG